ncbi:HD domain-containing phosphohydrolase [Pleionea sp. CnH1-48]|uniref:HD domain-containing phosphohydrolase n=1 Tax=Pleionea sp. CnH1-48 TaxID=2954494 RepID=UPI0020980E03|nr:HD domain-containing phosphohydrolase [Pleionea sp. CnH1-48]MCO7223737.1 response regulator [Pleionea sp. CnH1-48]
MENKKRRLLILDDEKEILKSLTRLLRKEYVVSSFEAGEEALAFLEDNPVDLIISDMRMPTMMGDEFLAKSRDIQPNAVRLLLTGYSDMESTISAINEGAIYSYIAKPWDNNEIKLVLANATKMQDLEREKERLSESLAERNKELEFLNNNLEEEVKRRSEALAISHEKLKKQYHAQNKHYKNLVDMLAEIIELRQPEGNGQLQRVASQCRLFATKIGLSSTDAIHVYLTAILHEIGKVWEGDDNHDYPCIGANILEKLPAFKIEAKAIRHQLENFDGSGTPEHLTKELIPIQARILRIVKAYDDRVSGKLNGTPTSHELAKKELTELSGELYDPELVKQFIIFISERSPEDSESVEYCVGTDEIRVGDTLKKDLIIPSNNRPLLTANQEITKENLARLKQYEKEHKTVLAIYI